MTPGDDVYRHRNHAGNAADRWKHIQLCHLVERLLRRMPKGRPFRYLETHAGPGLYRARFGTRGRRREMYYQGSWLQVLALSRAAQRPSDFLIVDRHIHPDLRSFGRKGRYQRVRGHQRDGFDAELVKRFRPHLVLVDPPFWPDPNQEWQAVADFVRALSAFTAPVALWYPGTGDYAQHVGVLDAMEGSVTLKTSLSSSGGGLRHCGLWVMNGGDLLTAGGAL